MQQGIWPLDAGVGAGEAELDDGGRRGFEVSDETRNKTDGQRFLAGENFLSSLVMFRFKDQICRVPGRWRM